MACKNVYRPPVFPPVCARPRRTGSNATAQLKHLNWLLPLEHTEIGTWPIKDIPFHFANGQVSQGGPTERAAPCYAEDNEYVYKELLGLSQAEMDAFQDEGVI